MRMKIGFIWFWGCIFIFVVGHGSIFVEETYPLWVRILIAVLALPGFIFFWLSFTSGGSWTFIEQFRIPQRFKEAIFVVGGGFRKEFPWMYLKESAQKPIPNTP